MADFGEAAEAALAGARGRDALRRRMRAGDELAWVELSEGCVAAEDGDGAVAVLMELVTRIPGSAEGWAALARIFESAGLAQDALGCWQQAVAAAGRADHLAAMGSLLQRANQGQAAAGCYVRALRADPDLVAVHHNLATLYVAAGQLDSAAQHYRDVVQRDPSHVRAWGNLGVVLRRLDRNDEAIDALEQAVLRDPSYGRGWANLASAREAANEIDGAREAIERARALVPGDPLMQLAGARIDRRQGQFESAAEALRGLTGPMSADLVARVQVELGFVLDRLGDPDGAFAAFTAGQSGLAALPESRAVDRSAYPGLLDRVEACADRLLAAAGEGGGDPVFVVGFPRSGTTLTEQILAAHPAFSTSDEAPLLERALGRVGEIVGAAYPEGLLEATEEQLDAVRAAYLGSLAGGRFVDKFPLNLVHLPAIRLLFPRARVVLVLRDPRDVVLSNFMQDFVPNEAMVHLHSPESAAALYDRVMGLWRAWSPLFPDVHVVRYEDVVADLEGTARALLEALGEPWDPRVLSYHERAAERRISTPSHQDVARPIFQRSRGRWRRYEASLAPVLPTLQPHVEAFGYGS